MKAATVKHEIVETIPESLQEGIIYLSPKYKTAIHLCCCGCKQEVVTPLNPADWSAKLTASGISLHPSIGNWSFACRSHYWIQNGKVQWSYPMNESEVRHLRQADQKLRESYIDRQNSEKGLHSDQGESWLSRMINKFAAWLKR